MKIIGVIPARYQSSRFPGKPLADICGKPMIWWVYQKVEKTRLFDKVVCAIDDERVKKVCEKYNLNFVMTRQDHPNHISRVYEVASTIEADYYMCVNGDEPLISKECIFPIIPNIKHKEPYFGGAMRELTDPAETIDFAKIKLAVSDVTGRCLYMSRNPIPYPRGTLLFKYKKYVGVECFNRAALEFFVNHEMGSLEKVEDIDHLRFLENGMDLHFTYVTSESISIDTPKDLEKVRAMISRDVQNSLLKK